MFYNGKLITRLTMSALGMVNLIWRSDRDRFIKINWSNVKDEYKYNFYPWQFDFVSSQQGNDFDYDSLLNFFDYQQLIQKNFLLKNE